MVHIFKQGQRKFLPAVKIQFGSYLACATLLKKYIIKKIQ